MRLGAYVVAIWNDTQIGLNLCNFGKKIILIPSSIAICERGFSKQNAIKSHLRNKLNLKTLDALMWVSLCGLEVDAMDWATIFNKYHHLRSFGKTKGYFHSINSNFVTNQDFILSDQNIRSSKIFYNPKLRWHFRI